MEDEDVRQGKLSDRELLGLAENTARDATARLAMCRRALSDSIETYQSDPKEAAHIMYGVLDTMNGLETMIENLCDSIANNGID